MSVEIHVLIARSQLPDRSAWQSALERLGLPLLLDPGLSVPDDRGFVPCRLRNRETGFELYVDDAEPLLQGNPTLRSAATGADCALSFRFAGDLTACASSLAAAAALVSGFKGTAYFPDDDLVHTLEGLLREIEECLAALEGEA